MAASEEVIKLVAPRNNKKRSKRKRISMNTSKEEKELEAYLFGKSAPDDTLDVGQVKQDATVATAGSALERFLQDLGKPEHHQDEESDKDQIPSTQEEEEVKAKRKPAWEDEDELQVSVDVSKVNRLRKLRTKKDETIISGQEYVRRLRATFNQLNHSANWADMSKERPDEDLDEEESFLQTTSKLTTSSINLRKGPIDLIRVKDANMQETSNGVIQSVQFHKNGQTLLTAGFDKKLRLFQIDGVQNSKIQSIFFPDMPIHMARFTADGREIIASGRRNFFYSYDVAGGKVQKIPRIVGRDEKSLERFYLSPANDIIAFVGHNGYIVLVSQTTKQWVSNLKMTGNVRACCFTDDGQYMFTTGTDGVVYTWDMRTRRCFKQFADEGCLHGTAIASSIGNKYMATGADSGVVNLYSQEDIWKSTPNKPSLPLKAIMNVTVPVDELLFNCDAQILAISSSRAKDCLKLVHTASTTTFSNWPTSKTPLHYVTAIDFSPNSGYLAIGNDRGRVLLYRIQHYERT